MSELTSRQQTTSMPMPLISEVYDIANISLNAITPSMTCATNLNQTYDNTSNKKQKTMNGITARTAILKGSHNHTRNNTLAGTKEEIIQDFITNERSFEQQKEFKLNELKTQSRMKSITTLQNVPEIDAKSNSIALIKNNKKPIYDRINEITQKRQENIESLRSLYIKSIRDDCIGTSNNTATGKESKAFKGYSKRTMKWVKEQEDWLKKKNRNNQIQITEMNEKEAINQMALMPSTQTQSTHRKINKDMKSEETLKTLYFKREIKKKSNESNPLFTPKLNRNRSETSKVYPNYNPVNPRKKRTKSNYSAKKPNVIMQGYAEKAYCNKPKYEHWSSVIMNLNKDKNKNKSKTPGKDEVSEYMYRINIYPTGAWNENSMNNVSMNCQTRKILSHLLS